MRMALQVSRQITFYPTDDRVGRKSLEGFEKCRLKWIPNAALPGAVIQERGLTFISKGMSEVPAMVPKENRITPSLPLETSAFQVYKVQ